MRSMKKKIWILSVIITLAFTSFNTVLAAASDHNRLSINRGNGGIKIELPGIVCDCCVQSLEKVFRREDAVKSIKVDLDNMMVTVNLKAGKNLSDEDLKKLVEDAGYNIRRAK